MQKKKSLVDVVNVVVIVVVSLKDTARGTGYVGRPHSYVCDSCAVYVPYVMCVMYVILIVSTIRWHSTTLYQVPIIDIDCRQADSPLQ